MCRLNLRDYLARPKQHSSGDGSSSLSSSPLLSFSPPLHTSPQQVLLSSFWWLPRLAQACWSMLPKSACRRSPPRSLLPRSSLNPTEIFDNGLNPTVILRIFVVSLVFYPGWLWGPLWFLFRKIWCETLIYINVYIIFVFSESPGLLSSRYEDFPTV